MAGVSSNTTLTELDLSDCGLDASAVAALSHLLRENTTLRRLGMRGTKLGAAGANALGTALRENNTLSTLAVDIEQSNLDEVAAFMTMLRSNTAITHLDISETHHPDPELMQLIASTIRINRFLAGLGDGETEAQSPTALHHSLNSSGLSSQIATPGLQVMPSPAPQPTLPRAQVPPTTPGQALRDAAPSSSGAVPTAVAAPAPAVTQDQVQLIAAVIDARLREHEQQMDVRVQTAAANMLADWSSRLKSEHVRVIEEQVRSLSMDVKGVSKGRLCVSAHALGVCAIRTASLSR